MAQSGHDNGALRCLLSGVKRTFGSFIPLAPSSLLVRAATILCSEGPYATPRVHRASMQRGSMAACRAYAAGRANAAHRDTDAVPTGKPRMAEKAWFFLGGT